MAAPNNCCGCALKCHYFCKLTDYKSRDYKYYYREVMMAAHRERFLAVLVERHMRQRALSVNALAGRLGCTYEQVRKIRRGQALPSEPMLRLLCRVLGMDLKRAKKMVVADKLLNKFGRTVWQVAGKNPDYEPFYVLWPFLTRQERRCLLAQMEAVARLNSTTERKD